MLAMSESLAVLMCLCLTGMATGAMITVNLEIASSHGSASECVGGQVGLTNTSILVHYRLYESTSPVGEWTFLRDVNISDNSQGTTVISTNISVIGVQLRFLQLEHGGEGCNCWNVIYLDINVIAGQAELSSPVPINVVTSYCHLNGLAIVTTGRGPNREERRIFCSGSASEARGVTTPVVYFNSTGDRCPGNSGDYLIAPKGRPLSENCSTTNPRM